MASNRFSEAAGNGTDRDTLIARLRAIVGRRHVLTGDSATRRYRHGYRSGSGAVIAVIRPASLVELWNVARICVRADCSIILQAANTGLTGGSTPDGDAYPGGVIIISTLRISTIHLLQGGRQAVCLPGTTLHALEKRLRPLGREPHSVIGSSCFGASVVGGVCNNSGGSLIQRGPAYTQLALFAVVELDGTLRLVNHLGIALGDDPEEMLDRLERGDFTDADIEMPPTRTAHDHRYADHVRDVDSDRPARFNADERCLFEASGSAGKAIVFAVRLDSFHRDADSSTFYIGTNDPGRLDTIRRTILSEFPILPISGEYIHRTAFDMADHYGRDMVFTIERLGTDRLPSLFAAKARLDAWASRMPLLGEAPSERMMQGIGRLLPDPLPRRMREYRDRFEHHLILKVADSIANETRALLAKVFEQGQGAFFECGAREASKAFLHRFVVAGAAVRFRAVHQDEVEDIVALDVALPRNARDWSQLLPAGHEGEVIHALCYGHFFCHVFHQDYIVRKGSDAAKLKRELCAWLDARGAEYPAEHNVGHQYVAKPALARFYQALDPRNQLNPGLGGTSRNRAWRAGGPCPADPAEIKNISCHSTEGTP
ncbi:D-lactate dehydrogenase [Stakelama tenebrarum]|uniref:Quinone-dependent D-lactate dehydrogenase n=1 Tax=Stakelama tenebrarum TaxID=2711215 RepID=A0A6G6YAC8_9SPHN|nr:D-lactate dehydrogenase [Sphingosinithalassobacter tenebrarum]QIG81894.1 D-lactate dehydrogenase [Sphingosinithalassobacter tenebrarum]